MVGWGVALLWSVALQYEADFKFCRLWTLHCFADLLFSQLVEGP